MVSTSAGSGTADGLRWLSGVLPAVMDAALLYAGPAAQRAGVSGGGPVGAVVQNVDGAIAGANPEAERLLGLTWDQMVGVTSMDPRWQAVTESGLPLPGDQHPAMITLATGQPVLGALMGVMVPPDGTTKWLEVTTQPLCLPHQDGTPAGVIALFTDVSGTPRGQHAYAALVQAYRLMAENSSDIVFRVGSGGELLWISPSVQTQIGWQPIELLGTQTTDLVHPDDLHLVERRRQLSGQGVGEQTYQVRMRTRDGSYRWMSALARSEQRDGEAAGATVVALRDVDERVRATEELAASERHYRMLAENSTDVIAHLRGWELVWVSPSVQSALGRSPGELIGKRAHDLVHRDDAPLLAEAQHELAAGRSTRITVRVPAVAGAIPWFDVVARPFLDEAGLADGVVLRLRDVSSEVAATRRLEHMARHDDLTGLANRKQLVERMRLITSAPPGSLGVAVAFCDIDHFKAVNDTHGHDVGDRLLQEIASRITGCVRSTDLVARIGGDEIVVVLTGVRGLDDARAVMEKIRQRVGGVIRVGPGSVTTSLSIGLCLASPGEDFKQTLRRADDAVYRAKQAGRNRVEVA